MDVLRISPVTTAPRAQPHEERIGHLGRIGHDG